VNQTRFRFTKCMYIYTRATQFLERFWGPSILLSDGYWGHFHDDSREREADFFMACCLIKHRNERLYRFTRTRSAVYIRTICNTYVQTDLPVSGLSARLGLRLPMGPRIVMCACNLYHSSIVLLNAVVPKLGGTHRSGAPKNYGNDPKLNYQLMKICIFT
jgi:hypothetical protein